MFVFSVISVLIKIVVWMVMCSELIICVFVRGLFLLYLVCRVIRFGILVFVILSFFWLNVVRLIFLMM